MARSNRSNPLALAVLTCLLERPMHPYEVAQTLRTRGKHHSIKLNFGSLYSVVEGLVKRGFIAEGETRREGNRPERTVYTITDSGRRELTDWLTELVATPEKEYLRFEAALSLLPGLAPDDTVVALTQRATSLELALHTVRSGLQVLADMKLPRLFALEEEYRETLLAAELTFVQGLIADISSGTLEGVQEWASWYRTGVRPDWPEGEQSP